MLVTEGRTGADGLGWVGIDGVGMGQAGEGGGVYWVTLWMILV